MYILEEQASKQADRQAGRQAGRQAKQASRQASKQASKHASKQTSRAGKQAKPEACKPAEQAFPRSIFLKSCYEKTTFLCAYGVPAVHTDGTAGTP